MHKRNSSSSHMAIAKRQSDIITQGPRSFFAALLNYSRPRASRRAAGALRRCACRRLSELSLKRRNVEVDPGGPHTHTHILPSYES